MTFDVHVIDDDGDAVEGTLVRVSFPGIINGGWLEEFTDEEGHAEFDSANDHDEVSIRVRGEWYGPFEVSEGAGFTISV